jgi:hypothetical protein
MHASINSSLSLNFKLGLCRKPALVQALRHGEREEGAERVGVVSVAVHAGVDSLFLPRESLPNACESISRVRTDGRGVQTAQGSQAFGRAC